MAKQQSKEQHEKHQAILSRLLKDEDNKYCVDCDAKGLIEGLPFLLVLGQHNFTFEFSSVSPYLTSIYRAMIWKCLLPSW